MAIYGIGAHFGEDCSQAFVDKKVVGVGWEKETAPALLEMVKSLKVGDIVYIKSFSPSSPNIQIKAIGIIIDAELVESVDIIEFGRNVRWLNTLKFEVPKPKEKNNVRSNTMYEEFNPEIQKEILKKILRQGI